MSSYAAAIAAGGLAALFTVLMAFQRSLYTAALCLLGVLLQAAVLFYCSGAPMLAFLQIMIYAGAIMVLVVVAIMAAPAPAERLWSKFSAPKPILILGGLLPAAAMGAMIYKAAPALQPAAPAGVETALGALLFGPWALATEAVTLLILLASLAVVEARK